MTQHSTWESEAKARALQVQIIARVAACTSDAMLHRLADLLSITPPQSGSHDAGKPWGGEACHGDICPRCGHEGGMDDDEDGRPKCRFCGWRERETTNEQ